MVRKELYAWWWMRMVEMVWEAMIPMCSAGLLFYGGWQVLEGALTIGDLMMFLVYLLMLLQPLAVLANSATQFQNSLSGLDRVLDLLDEPRKCSRRRILCVLVEKRRKVMWSLGMSVSHIPALINRHYKM